ncbi:MAG: hypothetical protein AMXMBFR59_40830 [Rhodanobacteraceae bacterium]
MLDRDGSAEGVGPDLYSLQRSTDARGEHADLAERTEETVRVALRNSRRRRFALVYIYKGAQFLGQSLAVFPYKTGPTALVFGAVSDSLPQFLGE